MFAMNDALNKALFKTFELDFQKEIIKALLLNGYRCKVISNYLDVPLERVESVGKSKRTLCTLDPWVSTLKFRSAVFKGWIKRGEYKKIKHITTAVATTLDEQIKFLKQHGLTDLKIRTILN